MCTRLRTGRMINGGNYIHPTINRVIRDPLSTHRQIQVDNPHEPDPLIDEAICVIKKTSGTILGTGFLVDKHHVITCRHLVTDPLTLSTSTKIRFDVEFPFTNRGSAKPRPSVATLELHHDTYDVAILKLYETVDRISQTPEISASFSESHSFWAFGFPDETGERAFGTIVGPVAQDLIELQTRDRPYIKRGFSGSPVYCDQKIVGIITTFFEDPDKADRALMLPMSIIRELWRPPGGWPPPLANPYKGLLAYSEADVALFFGREAITEELYNTALADTLTVVVGPSGVGKSSVVLAGLVPKLRKDFAIAIFRPSRDPLYSLARSIVPYVKRSADLDERERTASVWREYFANDARKLLDIARSIKCEHHVDRLWLIIDQFEELFALDSHDPKFKRFVEVMETVCNERNRVPSLSIVATMRSDYLGAALRVQPLAETIRSRLFLVGPMTEAQLADAIREPAKRSGLKFDRGLVDRIFAKMVDQPGSLALLQFTLARLWERREDRLLTMSAFERLGGIEGALKTHAQAIYSHLHEDDRAGLRRVMLRLVDVARPGSERGDIGIEVLFEDFEETEQKTVRRLADEHLLVIESGSDSGATTVKLSHEALIHAWPTFARWLDEDREFMLWRQRLRSYLETWQEGAGMWLRERLLEEALRWREIRRTDLSGKEQEFIEGSERADVEERRKERRKKCIMAAAAVLGVLILCVVAVGWRDERRRARTQLEAALAYEIVTIATDLMASSNRSQSVLQRGAALAVESWWQFPNVYAFSAMTEALERLPIVEQGYMSEGGHIRINHGTSSVVEVAIDNSATLVVSVSDDGWAKATQTKDGVERWSIPPTNSRVTAVTFSRDYKLIGIAYADGTARIINGDDGKDLRRIEHDFPVQAVAFSSDANFFASADEGGNLCVHTTRPDSNDANRGCHELSDYPISRVAFSNDGMWLAIGTRRQLRIRETNVYDIVGDIQLLPYSDAEGTFDGAQKTRLHLADELRGPNVSALVFSADSQSVAVAIHDWAQFSTLSPSSNVPPRPQVIKHGAAINALLLSSQTNKILTASDDSTVRVTPTPSSRQAELPMKFEVAVRHVAVDRRMDRIAVANITGSETNIVELLDVRAGSNVGRFFLGDETVTDLTLSADGNLIAIATQRGAVRVLPTDGDLIAKELCMTRQGTNLTKDQWNRYIRNNGYRVTCESWQNSGRNPEERQE